MRAATGAETREGTPHGNMDASRNGNEGSSRDENGNGHGEGWGGGGELWYLPYKKIGHWGRIEDQALPFYTRYHLHRHEVAPPGSQ